MTVLTSVVIATRNRPELLKAAIASVLAAGMRSLELVVVDDCSELDLQPLADSFGDDRVSFYRMGRRHGRVLARNFGVDKASGDIIVFLDDDDEFLEGGLASLSGALAREPDSCGLVYARPVYVKRDPVGGLARVAKELPGLGYSGKVFLELLRQNFIQPGAVAVKKAAFQEVGGFSGGIEPIALEDWRLWLQLAARYHVGYLDREVAQILRHEGNTPEALFTQSKCEYLCSSEFRGVLDKIWPRLLGGEREEVRKIILRFAASAQNLGNFAVSRDLWRHAFLRGAGVSTLFRVGQLWRSWLPRPARKG